MTAKMQGPANNSGFSTNGTSYKPDAHGCIEIPEDAINDAANHGFTLIGAGAASPSGPAPEQNLHKLSKAKLIALAKDDYQVEIDEKLKVPQIIEQIEALKATAEANAQAADSATE